MKNKVMFWISSVMWGLFVLSWAVSLIWVDFHHYVAYLIGVMVVYALILVLLQIPLIHTRFKTERRHRRRIKLNFKHAPRWSRYAAIATMALGCATAVLYIVLLFNGYLQVIDNTYWIMNDGEQIRELTLQEYNFRICLSNSLPATFGMVLSVLPMTQYGKATRRRSSHSSHRRS